MSEEPLGHDERRVLLALRRSMLDPALSGGNAFLGELFGVLADEPAALPLLRAIPAWKIPGLLLSAALVHRAAENPTHPLARYLPPSAAPLGPDFVAHVRAALADAASLGELTARHTYQCNPPRRLAVSVIALAAATEGMDLAPALHVDVGTASGIGLLLARTRAVVGDLSVGQPDASLALPLELRGAPLDVTRLRVPRIECAIGIDLDPPDLRDRACLSWMRACQYPIAEEWALFDAAIAQALESGRRIERGSATDWLPRLAAELPPGQPLIVTDTYVAVFMDEGTREEMRRELDAIARVRPVVWISNDPVVPLGDAPDRTTAGVPISRELVDRSHEEMFGTVCATTWQDGERHARLLGVTHPGGCWLEWRPDLAG